MHTSLGSAPLPLVEQKTEQKNGRMKKIRQSGIGTGDDDSDSTPEEKKESSVHVL